MMRSLTWLIPLLCGAATATCCRQAQAQTSAQAQTPAPSPTSVGAAALSLEGGAPLQAHPATRPGLAVAIGLGEPYAWVGGDLAYYVPVFARRFTLTPHVAMGRMPTGYGQPWEWGVRGGLMLMFGGRNRALLDLGYGAIGGGSVVLHGAPVATRVIEGVSVLGGYEWMWRGGLLLRVSAGPAYVTETLYPEDARLEWLFGIGLGWKPW